MPSNGCEANTTTSTANCGQCGRACNTTNVAVLSCSGGLCNSSCASGWGNCTEPAAPTADDGCESNLHTPGTCGSCTSVCALPNVATDTCPSGTCQVGTCSAGYLDCNAAPADGCECQTGPPNAGACCGTGCQVKHVNGDGTHYTGQNYFDCYPLGVPGTESASSSGGFNAGVPTNNPPQMAIDARSVFQYPSVGGSKSDQPPDNKCNGQGTISTTNCVSRIYNAPDGKEHCITWCFGDDTAPLMQDSMGFVKNKNSSCYNLQLPLTGAVCGTGGHLFDSVGSAGSVTCYCPWPTDPQWN
jgi:hypothetical protein